MFMSIRNPAWICTTWRKIYDGWLRSYASHAMAIAHRFVEAVKVYSGF